MNLQVNLQVPRSCPPRAAMLFSGESLRHLQIRAFYTCESLLSLRQNLCNLCFAIFAIFGLLRQNLLQSLLCDLCRKDLRQIFAIFAANLESSGESVNLQVKWLAGPLSRPRAAVEAAQV